MKETKRSLLTSATALILCFVMLIGTTFAWFTDEVTSANNIIKTGTLDISMKWSKDNATWKDTEGIGAKPVFDYDRWEPGYTEVRYIKVENLGSLAFKYQMAINPTGAIGKLAEVIDVSYDIVTDNASFVAPTAQNKQGSLKKVSTLADIIAGTGVVAGGVLLPDGTQAADYYDGEIVICIAFHMQETAGNEYQGASIGDAFGINLYATQYDYENDSFDNSYDDNATWPNAPIGGNTATAPVTNVNGILDSAVTMTSQDGKISATLPAGTKLEQGATEATLSVSDVENSQANITLGAGEAALSVDVHVYGVARDNDVPMTIYMAEALPVGLNMGNYSLYHVENGNTVRMTYVADAADLANHNEFAYDPATGDVTICLQSFSEVALVAEPAKWEGNRDYSWYTNAVAPVDGESVTEYTIANADQLAAFGAIVGGMAEGIEQDSFSGKTVKLLSDINLGDKESENNPDLIFYPIGYWNNEGTYERKPLEERETAVESGFYSFMGTFDGNGHTVSNFYQNTWEMKGDHNWYDPIKEQYYRDGMGLFGRVYKGTVKNITVKNFSSDGEITTTGTIAAYADGATFENIAIFNCNPRVYNIGNGGIVGCVGWYAKDEGLKTTFKNITVDNSNKISALWGSYDVACGGIVGQYYPTSGQSSANYPVNAGIHFDNCHISAQMDVYNDVCANYQYYAYRYTGMLIGSVRENETINGHSYPKMDGIEAKNCTVHFGDWNDYYYCEIVANSLASYTHDHQFSRLTQVAGVNTETKKYLPLGKEDITENWLDIPGGWAHYVVVNGEHASENATCYHFNNGNVHNHKDSGTEIVNGVEVLKEDNQHIYLEFNNLVTGYGWGVTSRGFNNLDGVTNLDIQQGNQEASVEKFEDAGYTPKDYKQGETITIGDLFKIKGNAEINGSSVYVSVSPVTDGDKVNATFVLNEEDWTKSTITFSADSTGTAKVTITDYIFCTPTTIYLNEEEAKDKFVSNNINAQNAYSQITLGSIFSVVNGATIGNVTATVTDPNGNVTTVNGTGADWATKSFAVIKEGTWIVSIVDDDKYCAATETTFTVNKVDKFTKKFDKNFLYRVGNENTAGIGYIFGEIETAVGLSSVNVSITNVAGNATGVFTANDSDWTKGTLKFEGTGVVKVTISADGAKPFELNLEVVDAQNATSAVGTTDGGNFVLLCDVNTSSFQYLWDCKLYGNGFVYSLKGAPTKYSSGHGHGVLITKNATLDNLVIVGDEYTEYGALSTDNYYTSAIDVTGNTTIQNCYISGCSAPVRSRSNVTIVNSTLYGGTVANLIIQSGTVTLTDVTTANYDDGRALVGMGIVVHSSASDNAKLVLNGTLTQYNFMSESKVPNNSYAKNLHTAMFDSSNSQYHFGTSSNRYVNTGIISMTSTFNIEDIKDNANTGYIGKPVSIPGVEGTGYVYTQPNTIGYVNNNYEKENDPYYAKVQGVVAPNVVPDYTEKNYLNKTEGSNDYCYEDSGTVYISMDQGDTFNWDTSILTITKVDNALNYTVSMNGTDYTGKSITFNAAGDYAVIYTYVDPYNYKLDDNGNATAYDYTHTYVVNITVSVIKPTTQHASFTFGSNGQATEKITVNNNTYISAVGVTANGTNWGSMDVNGTTIYFPIVEAEIVKTKDGNMINKEAEVQAHFYVLSGVVTITDYENAGTGNKITFDGNTKEMPAGLSVVKGKYAAIATNWYKNSDSNLNIPQSGQSPLKVFCYAGSGEGSLSEYNGKLCYSSQSDLSTKNRGEYYTLAQFVYQDNAGATYYYYVGYHMQNSKNVAPDSSDCVTPDTLVTLADGSQVRVDSLTGNEMLLVWNHQTGALESVPVAYIVDHEGVVSEREIISLKFANGKSVKIIGEHVFFDATLNKYVAIASENAESFIGHKFAALDANGETLEMVDLISVEREVKETAVYEVVSYKHLTCFTEGILSTSAFLDPLLNTFDIDSDTMAYDAELVQKDIETYGLYTYADFEDLISEEAFELYNAAYLKIAIGKGYITWDDILEMIDIYFDVNVQPIQ